MKDKKWFKVTTGIHNPGIEEVAVLKETAHSIYVYDDFYDRERRESKRGTTWIYVKDFESAKEIVVPYLEEVIQKAKETQESMQNSLRDIQNNIIKGV